MGGMLGVAMAEVILHGAQIATSFTAPCSAHPVARYAKLNFNLVASRGTAEAAAHACELAGRPNVTRL